MRNVYLINLSFGLAGIERRFANIWRALRERGNVRPILIVPDTLAELLYKAKLASPDEDLWTVAEHPWLRALGRIRLPALLQSVEGILRSRPVAWSYRSVWDRIREDATAVVHIGLNCSALVPPDAPLVYECVDSTLSQLGTRHYIRASMRRCIIHCQTGRIRQALEHTMASRHPQWTTVVSPIYFSNYLDRSNGTITRDPCMVAFVGRLSPEKRPLLFIDAVARARARGFEIRALMLGEGPLLREVRRRIAHHGLASVVEISFDLNPPRRLQQAAVYLTLQRGDNYGSQSLLEAMGAGCAIVATAVGETGRIVSDDIGVMVKPDPDQVAAAIVEFVSNPHRTAMRGAAASRLARTQYTSDAYAAFLESLYSDAVNLHGSLPS